MLRTSTSATIVVRDRAETSALQRTLIIDAGPSTSASIVFVLLITAFAPPPDRAIPPNDALTADAEDTTLTVAVSIAETFMFPAVTMLSRTRAVIVFDRLALASETEIAAAPPRPTEPATEADRTVASMVLESVATTFRVPE